MKRDQHPLWFEELRNAFVDPIELLNSVNVSAHEVRLSSSGTGFPFRVPRPFAARIKPATPNDPLLIQVLPTEQEQSPAAGFDHDPVGDLGARRTPALLHKYEGRALLIATGGCAINCRYCFRRHYPYAQSVGAHRLEAAVEEIRDDPSISEVIISGGDPLMLRDDNIAELVNSLASITHLRRLRVHSRLPVTIPSRLTDELLNLLTATRLTPVLVVHINHAQEIDGELAQQLQRCSKAGIQLLNQSVLLRGVNDNVATLCDLSEALFEAAVVPYYVHLLDRVSGAAHFDVNDDQAREIAERMRARLPGYLMPRFVREVSGQSNKTPIA
jgi:EF-P beta-lysylation protein EpmB